MSMELIHRSLQDHIPDNGGFIHHFDNAVTVPCIPCLSNLRRQSILGITSHLPPATLAYRVLEVISTTL